MSIVPCMEVLKPANGEATSKPAIELATPTPQPAPLTVAGESAGRPITDQMREAARLRYGAGLTFDEIGLRLKVCRQTVSRYLKRIAEAELENLGQSTPISLIGEKLQEIRAIREIAMRQADQTKSERSRSTFLNTALRASNQEVQLLLDAGIIPKAPDKIYSQVLNLKPDHIDADSVTPRSRQELVEEMLVILQRTTTL